MSVRSSRRTTGSRARDAPGVCESQTPGVCASHEAAVVGRAAPIDLGETRSVTATCPRLGPVNFMDRTFRVSTRTYLVLSWLGFALPLAAGAMALWTMGDSPVGVGAGLLALACAGLGGVEYVRAYREVNATRSSNAHG